MPSYFLGHRNWKLVQYKINKEKKENYINREEELGVKMPKSSLQIKLKFQMFGTKNNNARSLDLLLRKTSKLKFRCFFQEYNVVTGHNSSVISFKLFWDF